MLLLCHKCSHLYVLPVNELHTHTKKKRFYTEISPFLEDYLRKRTGKIKIIVTFKCKTQL